MISGEETVVFVWRCPGCSAVYDGEGMSFLYADEAQAYCPCGGVLVEDVGSVEERRYRLVVPEGLRGTALHRQLERYETEGSAEVTVGGREDGSGGIFSGSG